MKRLFNRLINLGIGNDTDLILSDKLKRTNIFNIFFVSLLLICAASALLFNLKILVLLELITIILYIGLHSIIRLFGNIQILNISSIVIILINLTIAYFLLPEISTAILFLILLFPIASMAIYETKGFWISLFLLTIIITGNFIPFENGFLPLNNLNLILFIVAFLAMGVASQIIYLHLDERINDQLRKVDFYEKEIGQRDEFITKLSHKLRTSLSNITLINNLVHDARMSSAQKELHDTLKMSTIDLINNVNELVEIATPTILDYKQSILSFNLGEALIETADILKTDKRLDQSIRIKGDEDIEYHVIGDPSLLRSVLINLSKGITSVGLNVANLVIEVSLDYETQNKYGLKFSLLFSASETDQIEAAVSLMQKNKETQSTYLNLASRLLSLTSSKAEFQFHGEEQSIIFYQDFSKDLTRKIVIPPFEGKVEKDAKAKTLIESTLLLVEDNAVNQKIVILSLDKMVKKIDVANNGKEALDMFGTKKYDAILMDIQMPVMDGIMATKKIREIEATSDVRIPIIAITANALSGDRDNCLAAGADDYLSKPFQVEELIAKITSLLLS